MTQAMTAVKRRTKGKRTNAQWGRDPRVKRARLAAVHYLRERGFAYKEIAIALYVTPWQVRTLEAKANRQTQCTCPAAYDHTVMGHRPDCPTHTL
jgi:DNA-binding CsgD family transcriptional regulator